MPRNKVKKKETIPLSEHEKIKKYLQEEILRKDGIIEKLKQENNLLIRTALKRADALGEMAGRMEDALSSSVKKNR